MYWTLTHLCRLQMTTHCDCRLLRLIHVLTYLLTYLLTYQCLLAQQCLSTYDLGVRCHLIDFNKLNSLSNLNCALVRC